MGAILFNLGEERLPGVPWRRCLARALGDAMVVFFGWLVLILGGYNVYSRLQSVKSNLDGIWQIEYGDNIAIFDIR